MIIRSVDKMANFQLAEIVALNALCGKVVEQCTRITVTTTNNWYTGQKSLDEFYFSVDLFRQKEQEWRRLLKRYGMTDHQELKARLDDAVRRLEEEEARVSQFKQSRLQRWWKGVTSLMFPDELSTSIQRVSDAFDDILKHLQDKSETSDLLRRAGLYTPSRLAFDLDQKYVPLWSTFSSVVTALEDEDCPDVIVLYGEPGTGKSSLARYLAITYQNGPSKEIAQAEDRKFPVAPVHQSIFSDGVYFLPCGPQAESISCHHDLLLMLGLVLPKSDEENQQRDVLTQLNEQLRVGLRELSALIVLDDVWDEKLIDSLLVPGRKHIRRKYLITSQNAQIWRNARSIPMEAVALEDARSILATHVGFKEKQIPLDLQPTADSLIKRTGANPLALASLALAIGEKDRHHEEKWVAVEEDLTLLLEDETLPQHLMYPTTVASSFMLALKSVPSEALELLYLATLCEGPAVPELVMQTFYCFLNGGPSEFIQWTNYLENSALVQVQDYKFTWSMVYQKTWSVHGLRQYFIQDKRKEDLQPLTDRLLGVNNEGNIDSEEAQTEQDLVIALCAVYGDVREESVNDYGLVERGAERFGISLREVCGRKKFIKAMVWCLHSRSKEKWRNESRRLGRKVILHFTRHGDLDESDLLDLLALDHDHACSTACWALGVLLGTEEGLFFTCGRYQKVLKKLLELMDQTILPLSRETAAYAFMKFTAREDEERKEQLLLLLSIPTCLQSLVKLVAKDTQSYAVRQCAACILGNLAAAEEYKLAIGALPGAIQALADLATEDSSGGKEVQVVFGVQELGHAARALANIAAADDHRIALAIASQPKLVDVLIDSLTNKDHPSVRESAARALATLQTSSENTNIIGSNPKVFENLLMVLDDDEHPVSQKLALGALISLAKEEKYRYAVTKIFNAKETLVRLLKSNEPQLHEAAAFAVGYLVLTPGCDVLKRNTIAALRGLVFLLGSDDSALSYRAVSFLSSFVYKKEENKKLLLGVPGVLEGVVGMLAETKTPDQQAGAGTFLSGLLDGNLEVSQRVLAIPHALDRLVGLLSAHNKLKLQPAIYAALTITFLAQSIDAQRIIVTHPRVFHSLVRLLDVGEEEPYKPEHPPLEVFLSYVSSPMSRREDYSLESLRSLPGMRKSKSGDYELPSNQRHLCAEALSTLTAFLSCSDAELRNQNQLQILAVHDQEPIQRLIRLVNDVGSSNRTRNRAVMLLSSMALPRENKRKVAACPHVFNTLFNALTMEDNQVKASAAWGLSNLFINKQEMGSLDSVPDALDNLAEMLLGGFSNSSDRVIHQEVAASAMVNLTASRANKLAIAKSSRALSSILEIINQGQNTASQSPLPLDIRRMALQILANVASIQKSKDILKSCGSLNSSIMEILDDLLDNAPEPMMQYLAAYTAARLDWEMATVRKLNSPEALFGRANAGVEMKHNALALADLRTLSNLERKPDVPNPLTFPHLWYSTWYAAFFVRILSVCNRMARFRLKLMKKSAPVGDRGRKLGPMRTVLIQPPSLLEG